MNFEERLMMYRQQYGLEREEVKVSEDLGFTPGFREVEQTSQFIPQERPQFDGPIVEDGLREGDREEMMSFFAQADNDDILTKDIEQRDAAMMAIYNQVQDPTNPMDEAMGQQAVKDFERLVYGQ